MSVEQQAGEPARVQYGWEVIGPEECPLMYRMNLLVREHFKVLLHWFTPGAADKDPHDHPRPFVTILLKGGYDDVRADGSREKLRAPAIRFRRAEHEHVTEVHGDGCLSLCIMGPLRREWGFWRDGEWFEWKTYERLFGLNWRCE